MKLADFLTRALETGHARFKLTSSARGVEIACGDLAQAKPEELEALAREDAAPLSREALHDYALVVESEDGAKRSRIAIRVHGAKGEEEKHTVDAERSQTPGAVIGHLTRLIVEQNKAMMAMVSKVVDRDISDTKELGRLRRAFASRGDTEIVKRQLELEAEEQKEERARTGEMWARLFSLAEPLALKLLPGGQETAIAKLRASLTEKQAEAMCAIVGPAVFSRMMVAAAPPELATVLLENVTREQMAQLVAVLNESQQAVMGAALSAEMKRREAAAAASAANGAAS